MNYFVLQFYRHSLYIGNSIHGCPEAELIVHPVPPAHTDNETDFTTLHYVCLHI